MVTSPDNTHDSGLARREHACSNHGKRGSFRWQVTHSIAPTSPRTSGWLQQSRARSDRELTVVRYVTLCMGSSLSAADSTNAARVADVSLGGWLSNVDDGGVGDVTLRPNATV